LNINSIGSSIVIICSFLFLFISSIIETIDVDFQDQVGQVTKTSQSFIVRNFFTHSGNHNFSNGIASDAILLITKFIFPNEKNQLHLKDALSKN